MEPSVAAIVAATAANAVVLLGGFGLWLAYRTRRAERSTWALIEADPAHTNQLAATYLNRLSDLLFILARCANSGADVLWQPGGPSAV